MIRLKRLLTEGVTNLRTVLGATVSTRNPTWMVDNAFNVLASSGIYKKTNVYYGSAQVSSVFPWKIKAQKGDVLISLPGGDYLVSEKRNSAWRIIHMGPETSLSLDSSERTKIPKSSVTFMGEAEDVGYPYQMWKGWIKGK